MGIYISTRIKKDIPDDALSVLQHLFDWGNRPSTLPDHPLFQTERWDSISKYSSDYFSFSSSMRHFIYDTITNNYHILFLCNMKTYNNEIEKFFQWINPYLDVQVGDHIGHYRYEEDTIPTLLYKR
jgi:hypothetical protein